MDPGIRKPTIEIIYRLAKHGLVHARRWCDFCGHRMRLIRTNLDYFGYVWVCPICFEGKRITASTPMNTINILVFDYAVSMFARNYMTTMVSFMSFDYRSMLGYLALFRQAYAHYVRQQIMPYLVLPGPCEIDEAKIGIQRWDYKGCFPKNIKWAFGIFC
jgi:hypothetical protein